MKSVRKYFQKNHLENTEQTSHWGVTIYDLGHHIHTPNTSYPDNQHPKGYFFDWEKGRVLQEFQLLYIAHGSGIFESEGVPPTLVEAGTAFLLFPGVWHRYKPSESTGWEEFWVGFKGPYADYLMQQGCFSPTFPLIHIGLNAELLQVFMHLSNAVQIEVNVEKETLRSCLTIQLLALVYASALLNKTEKSDRSQIIQRARFVIHEHEEKQLDMPQLASELNVSYAWFRKEFKETIGISPGQYHLNVRINRAKRLLRESDMSVGQIAYQTGFESEFYFSRIFKNKAGISPLQFRRVSAVSF